MSSLVIGLGAACCAAGAVAHYRDQAGPRPRALGEGAYGLAGFTLLVAGMFLTRS